MKESIYIYIIYIILYKVLYIRFKGLRSFALIIYQPFYITAL